MHDPCRTQAFRDECSGYGMAHAWVILILGNPGMTHSVPTAFSDECSGYKMGHAWVTEDVKLLDVVFIMLMNIL